MTLLKDWSPFYFTLSILLVYKNNMEPRESQNKRYVKSVFFFIFAKNYSSNLIGKADGWITRLTLGKRGCHFLTVIDITAWVNYNKKATKKIKNEREYLSKWKIMMIVNISSKKLTLK